MQLNRHQKVQKHIHMVRSHSKCCSWCQNVELVSFTVNPTASVASSKLLLTCTPIYRPNLTEGLKWPNWEGHKHTSGTKIHTKGQRPKQWVSRRPSPYSHLVTVVKQNFVLQPQVPTERERHPQSLFQLSLHLERTMNGGRGRWRQGEVSIQISKESSSGGQRLKTKSKNQWPDG